MRRALKRGGGFYSTDDIIAAVKEGKMGWISTDKGDGHCVVQVAHYPQKVILHIVVAFGSLDDDFNEIQAKCVAFGKQYGCTEMRMIGRPGWTNVLPQYGWEEEKVTSFKLDLMKE
jgi:hypothetical protein